MKRILSFVLLLLVFALTFTSCEWFNQQQPQPEVTYDLDGAVKYFKNVQYPDWKNDGATTPNDQILVSQVLYKLVAYKVTWVCDNDALAIVDNGNGTLTLDVPKVAEDLSYSLTATIADGNGNKQEVKFNLVVPANLAGEAVKPVAGTGYYLQIQQNSLKQVLFFNGKPESESKTYRLAMTTNAGDAVEVFVEEVEGVEGAYRLYFDNNGTKTYLVVKEQENEGAKEGETAKPGAGKGTIVWSTEIPTEYYTYNETYKTFVHTDAEGEDSYYMGTYSTYNTISVSNLSYVTDSNVDKSQFPVRFVTPDSVPAHTCKYVSVVTAPTCEAKGYTTHTCSLCNVSYTDSEVAMLEHNWTETEACTNGCGKVKPTAPTVTLTHENMGLGDYKAGTVTVNGVEFGFTELGYYGNGIQMRIKNGNAASLWNNTAFSAPIAKIELVYNSAKDTYNNSNAFTFKFGNAKDALNASVNLSTVAGTKTYTITPDAQTYTCFSMTLNVSYSFYWDSITIVLVDGTVITAN